MKNSKFIEAYLNIIKEETEQFPVATTPNVTSTLDSDKQTVCFKTSNKDLIDAINSGFDEVVFFVKAKDETTGEDTVQEVKFGPDAFEDFEIKAEEEGACPECGENDGECACEDAENTEVTSEDTEDSKNDDKENKDTENTEVTGENTENTETMEEDTNDAIEGEEVDVEEIDPSEWIEDGVCVKCGSAECDGTCKCEKCGSVNCIGDCEGEVETECGDGSDSSSDSI